MTKQDILDYFNDINQVYNDSTRLDSLSNMIDEMLETAREKENKYDMAIKAIHDIKEKVWEIDIPHPSCPEYIEHHEQIKSVLIVIYNWLTKLEEANNDN